MVASTPRSLQELKLWPSKSPILLLLILSALYLPKAFSQNEGYTNIHFDPQPMDVYTTTSINIAAFHCKAKGVSTVSGDEELLDARVLRNGLSLNNTFFPAESHGYLVSGERDYVVGIAVQPVQQSDNGSVYQCQAWINGSPVNVFSQSATLIVGDGQPPSIPLSLSSVGLYQITVSWSTIMLPSNGPILEYKAEVYTTSDVLVYSRSVDNGDIFQYTFTDLNPSTTYKLSIVGINMYGEGDANEVLLQATTQEPVVTGPPSFFSFSSIPGDGNIVVSVQGPLDIDNETMTPVTHYSLMYRLTSDNFEIFSKPPVPISNPHFYIYGLTVGASYTFSVTADNSAGSSEPLVKQYVIAAYTGTQALTPTTLTSSTTITQAPSTTVTTAAITTSVITSTITTSSQTLVLTTTTNVVPVSSPSTPSPQGTTSTTSTTSTLPSTDLTSPHSTSVSTTSTSTLESSSSVGDSPSTQHVTLQSSSVFTSTTSTTTSSTSSSSSSSSVGSEGVAPSSSSGPNVVQPKTGSTDDIPINAVVLAIGIIAAVILIAIIVVAILLVFFCIRSKKDNENFTDFEPTTWPHKPNNHMKKTWGSKDSSIKGSPLSGSITHSFSDDIDLPIEGRYLQVPSDSPPSIKGSDQDYRCADESKRESTEIRAEINGGVPPCVTPV